jgi:hypothetical protein
MTASTRSRIGALQPTRGQEVWRVTFATAYATVKDGVVTRITIINPGSGRSSEPNVSVPGIPEVHVTAMRAFGKDFAKNGSFRNLPSARRNRLVDDLEEDVECGDIPKDPSTLEL